MIKLRSIRILLLRILVAWWMIPFAWTVGWLLACLLFGHHIATEISIEMTKAVWFGYPSEQA